MNDTNKSLVEKQRIKISIFKADVNEKVVDYWFRKRGWSPLYTTGPYWNSWVSSEGLKRKTELCGNQYLTYSQKCPFSKKYLYYTSGYPERLANLFVENGISFSVSHIYVTYEKTLA